MTIRINNLRIPLDGDISELKGMSAKKLHLKAGSLRDFKIIRESVDARRKNRIDFIYTVEFSLDADEKSIADRLGDSDVIFTPVHDREPFIFGHKKLAGRPVVIGSGPAGLFAGLILAKNGYRPVIFERGKDVEERTRTVKRFWQTGDLDTDCNVQFGEGGAGTFSDGKLTTRIRDDRVGTVLDEFVKSGAPAEIIYNYKPHIGTDKLKTVVANMRREIISLGGEVHFSSRLTDIKAESGILTGITINDSLHIDCEVLVLAIGHSARDTIEMLYRNGVRMSAKPFAVGFRIEHRQLMIDEAQYGRFADHPKLRAADYRLTYHSKKYDRPCYTFCMCPGGVVVAASSEENMTATNGMSEYARDRENANSAIVSAVAPGDFSSSSPLAGMEFQRELERCAFKLGGGDYMAPVQRVDDFLKGSVTAALGSVKPSYTRGYRFADLSGCVLPVSAAVIREALCDFDRKIKGFGSGDGVLTGVETRTSSPVRIERDESCRSLSTAGIYPAGEGAGYAGGIVTSAVDGMRVAEEIMKIYAPVL
jgi:uncharacterized FAD-dependent dehydrogenase